MTADEQQQVAEALRRVLEAVDRGEVVAAAWYRERLVGAMLALSPSPSRSSRDAG